MLNVNEMNETIRITAREESNFNIQKEEDKPEECSLKERERERDSLQLCIHGCVLALQRYGDLSPRV